MEYYSLNQYLKDTFGEKLYKIAIDGGFTCPNRDGTLDTCGCIFCSGAGSGDFAQKRSLSVTEQIERGKQLVAGKMPAAAINPAGKSASLANRHTGQTGGRYIAYFQAFTNTYAPVSRLRALYEEAIVHPEIAVLSVATRPDCLPDDVIDLLAELNAIKPVWVELGLQTIHEKTADYIRRGYPLSVYDDAIRRLQDAGLTVITHVILGLPGETFEDMKETVAYVGKSNSDIPFPMASWNESYESAFPENNNNRHSPHIGIKLQLLHVLEGTDLATDYRAGKFQTLSLDEYTRLICECLALLPPEMVIHRMTGDGAKKILIAPEWSKDKKRVLNTLRRAIEAYEL